MANRKVRPYRVDYFDICEMQGDRALVRSAITRVATTEEAKHDIWNPADSESRGRDPEGRIIVRAYRFYKKLAKQPKRKTYIAIEKLFPGAKAVAVMDEIEAYRNRPQPTSGPNSPATKAVVEDLSGMVAHDQHEQTVDTFVPDVHADPHPFEDNIGMFISGTESPEEAQPQVVGQIMSNGVGIIDLSHPDTKAALGIPCPSSGIGVDDNGDSDCAVCTSPVYAADELDKAFEAAETALDKRAKFSWRRLVGSCVKGWRRVKKQVANAARHLAGARVSLLDLSVVGGILLTIVCLRHC